MTLPIGEPRTAGRRVVRRRFMRPDVARAKVALPNGLTLGNLFFGINAIIAASRGNFDHACLFVVLGGVCDAFDGAAARATRTGGRFGEELDSLVDAISFGLAPAMIVHFSTLAANSAGALGNWAVFIFAACAVMRLARFNVTQAGGSKTYFQGLPSPAAGGTLATYYWFSQTDLYRNNEALIGLPWGTVMQWLMIALGFLMVSSVPYPAWPKVGLRSLKGILGLAAVLFILFGIGYWRRAFFFPFGIAYVTYGLLRMLALGMWERRPGRDAYTGAPLPRRGTPRSSSLIPEDIDELDASDLIDPEDLVDEDEYDFFEDEEEVEEIPVRPARASGGMRIVRPERSPRAETLDRGDAGDRAERLERKKKRKKKGSAERGERPAGTDRGPRAVADAATPLASGLSTDRSDAAARERPAREPRPPREQQREPREPREPRPPLDVARVDRAGLAEAAPMGDFDGDEGADLDAADTIEGGVDGARDGMGRPDGERRKRRKRRRGNRGASDVPGAMDATAGTAADVGAGEPRDVPSRDVPSRDMTSRENTPQDTKPRDATPHDAQPRDVPAPPPFSGPRPFASAPPFSGAPAAAPSAPPASPTSPSTSPYAGEDSSE